MTEPWALVLSSPHAPGRGRARTGDQAKQVRPSKNGGRRGGGRAAAAAMSTRGEGEASTSCPQVIGPRAGQGRVWTTEGAATRPRSARSSGALIAAGATSARMVAARAHGRTAKNAAITSTIIAMISSATAERRATILRNEKHD